MDRFMAVWVDHERALIVTIASYGMVIQRLRSDVEKRIRVAGGSRSRAKHGPQEVCDEPSRNARHEQQLKRYYRRVVRELRAADDIYICGPGEAKIELGKALAETSWGADRLRAVEPADKMTDRQFKALAREVFEKPHARPAAPRSAGRSTRARRI